MHISDILTLFDYNYWANDRILSAAGRLLPDQYTAPHQVSYGSLHGTLVHTLGAEMVWRQRIKEGSSPTMMISQGEVPTLDALVERWRNEEQTMRGYLSSVTEADLNNRIHYNNLTGKAFDATLWHILTHMVTHGMQHRSECAILLTNYGQSPGDIDFMLYVREKGL